MKRQNLIQLFCFIELLLFLSCNNSTPTTTSQKDSLPSDKYTPKENRENIPEKIIKSPNTAQQQESVTVKDSNTIELGWQDTYDKLPILEFENISKSKFITYKNNYHTKLDTNSTKITYDDSTFTIKTSKSKRKYPNRLNTNNYTTKGYSVEYKGFNNYLKLYILESISVGGDFSFGYSFFIDSLTNKLYSLIGHSDYSFEPSVFSPNNEYMVTYVYDLLSPHECFLGVIKISKDNGVFTYKEFASAQTELIEELVWINDNSFAIKINYQTYNENSKKWDDNFSYAKTILPK